MGKKTHDVFLSHNSRDKSFVRDLAVALKGHGIDVWFDEEDMLAGQPWQEQLETALESCRTVAVVVGKSGLGRWETPEMRTAIAGFARRRIAAVIPVLIPGAQDNVSLPVFLDRFHRVDLRAGLTPVNLERLVAGIRGKMLPKGADPALAAYRAWAMDRYRGLSLIGLGAADVRMRFEEVYVPLRIARRPEHFEMGKRAEAPGSDEIEIEGIFATGAQHGLILGHPGAGKTTSLLKLLHLTLPERSRLPGLPEGMVPVLLPLRHLQAADLDRPLADFIERELAAVSGGTLPSGLGARLWERGRLLLLLDGLDEIAEEGLRTRVSRFLDFALAGSKSKQVRAVISCRFAGYTEKVRLGENVLPMEVRPLGPEQCEKLIQKWFQEARHAVRDYTEAVARKAAQGLNEALSGPGYGTQQWKVLIGSPLLLTLLCVIVLRGGQMPRQRVAFFDQSLRVLLAQWNRGRREGDSEVPEPPLDVETALAVLRSLAWELHSRHSRDDLSLAEIADHVEERLQAMGRPARGFKVADWLHREAGVLAEYAPGQFGFLHLGMQEYLTALHVATEGEELLDVLCAGCGDEWWHEVLLLLVGMPGRKLFAPLMERFLVSASLEEREELIRACLAEAAEADLEPLLARLDPGEPPESLSVVLRLVRGRTDPRLAARVAPLCEFLDLGVRALAQQIVDDLARPATVAEPACDLLVVHHPEDQEASAALVSALRRTGWRVLVAGQDQLSDEITQGTRAVALLAGPSGKPVWEVKDRHSILKLLARRHRPIVPVRLAGSAPRPTIPEELHSRAWLDLGSDLKGAANALQLVLAEATHAEKEKTAHELRVEPGSAWTEPLTGIRFLWIPGGRFRMGGTEHPAEQPLNWVRISPFWLGETPVTNRQYAIYLEKTGHKEPPTWRDKRFSAPEQPVVGVSWEDAQTFCRWLSDLIDRGVTLPSEAQWEFAARGTDGREYPWGEKPPDATLACFDLDWETGQPSPVGSFPAGRGPFGTLDQAGNVWEWCLDVLDEEAYAKRANREEVDPVGRGGADSRVVRGSGWRSPAECLRAAFRGGYPAGYRLADFGFRVAAAPASTLKP